MFTRLGLFVLTNVLVMVTVTVILSLTGLDQEVTASTGLDYRVTLIFALVWGFVGAFLSLAISRMVAKKLMRIKIVDQSYDGAYAWLVPMVENVVRQSSLEVTPEIGIYKSDDVNAFATGPTKKRSLVAFSTALLNQMDRESVEGVVAHEIAHIENGDMVTMTLIQGVVNAFVIFVARILAYAASNAVKEELSSIVWYGTYILLQIVFGFLAMFVTSAFSRKREFRADAGAGKLVGREKMIKGLRFLKELELKEQNEDDQSAVPASLQALAISSKKKRKNSKLLRLLSTHPPLERRIEALESFTAH